MRHGTALTKFAPSLGLAFKALGPGALALIAGCSALPQKDLREQYFEATRSAGLTPVYPPSERFQVGDVYFVSFDPDDQNNLKKRDRFWLGTLNSVRTVANEYLTSRINFENTALTSNSNGFDLKPDQEDLKTGTVTRNDTERRTLPLVSFPSITGAASSAANFGGFGFTQSFALGLGQSETVSLDFGDTRATGLPDGGVAIGDRYENEFFQKVCPALKSALFGEPDAAGIFQPFQCPRKGGCVVSIVTNTVVTRKFRYTYSSAAISQLAVNQLARTPAETPTQTLGIPGNLDLNITLENDPDGAALSALTTKLSNDVAAGQSQSVETNGARFVGLRGNGLVFDRTFLKPITIGYDARAGDPNWFAKNVCGMRFPQT